MANKSDLKNWLIDALNDLGGEAHHVDLAKQIWAKHRGLLEASGDLFYTWQYDLRWAADSLRREGQLQPKPRGDQGPWRLAERSRT